MVSKETQYRYEIPSIYSVIEIIDLLGDERMIEKSIAEAINCIAAFLVDRSGNEIFDKWKEKRKIKKILKNDKKNIERIFLTHEGADLYNLVEEFIIFSVFINPVFYSPMSLSEEQEEKLWKVFQEFLEKEEGNKRFEINKNNKEKIIRCVNLHNEAINGIIMDEKSKIHIKAMQSEHESIRKSLNQIIDTLNTDTPLQEKNDNLGFMVSQMESIMKSYRFDISQLRRLQLVCFGLPMLIMLIMAITIPLSLRYVKETNSLYIILIFVAAFIVLSLIFGGNISFKLKHLEERMSVARRNLFDFHTDIYYNLINEEYKKLYFPLEELEEIIETLIRANLISDEIEDLEREVELCIKQMKELYKKEYNRRMERHHFVP